MTWSLKPRIKVFCDGSTSPSLCAILEDCGMETVIIRTDSVIRNFPTWNFPTSRFFQLPFSNFSIFPTTLLLGNIGFVSKYVSLPPFSRAPLRPRNLPYSRILLWINFPSQSSLFVSVMHRFQGYITVLRTLFLPRALFTSKYALCDFQFVSEIKFRKPKWW